MRVWLVVFIALLWGVCLYDLFCPVPNFAAEESLPVQRSAKSKFTSSRSPERIKLLQQQYEAIISKLPKDAALPLQLRPPLKPSKACLATYRGCRTEYVEFLEQLINDGHTTDENRGNDNKYERTTDKCSSRFSSLEPLQPKLCPNRPNWPHTAVSLKQLECQRWVADIVDLQQRKSLLQKELKLRMERNDDYECNHIVANLTIARQVAMIQWFLSWNSNSVIAAPLLVTAFVVVVVCWILFDEDPHQEVDKIVEKHNNRKYVRNSRLAHARSIVYSYFKMSASRALSVSIQRLRIVGTLFFAIVYTFVFANLVVAHVFLVPSTTDEEGWPAYWLRALLEKGIVGFLFEFLSPHLFPLASFGFAVFCCRDQICFWIGASQEVSFSEDHDDNSEATMDKKIQDLEYEMHEDEKEENELRSHNALHSQDPQAIHDQRLE